MAKDNSEKTPAPSDGKDASYWTRFQKGRKKTGGRKKGTKDKYTQDVAKALRTVYNKIGGDEALAEFAKDNPDSFYKLHSKLLPKTIDVNITDKDNLVAAIQKGRKRVANKPKKR